jgi:transcriptional regulator with XRE-family HTH domain
MSRSKPHGSTVSPNRGKEFNWNQLRQAYVTQRTERDMSQREVCRAINEQVGRKIISFSTLSRFERGDGLLDAERVQAVCDWMGLPVANFTVSGGVKFDGMSTPDKIEALLFMDETLTNQQRIRLADAFRASYKALVTHKEEDT